MNTLAIFGGSLGWTEIVIISIIALLLFGRRLPEVGRSLGKGIVEFKKGLKGVEEEVSQASEPDRARRDEYAAPRSTVSTSEPARMPPPAPRSSPVVNTPGATARRSDLVD